MAAIKSLSNGTDQIDFLNALRAMKTHTVKTSYKTNAHGADIHIWRTTQDGKLRILCHQKRFNRTTPSDTLMLLNGMEDVCYVKNMGAVPKLPEIFCIRGLIAHEIINDFFIDSNCKSLVTKPIQLQYLTQKRTR